MPQNEAFVLRCLVFAVRMMGFFGDIARCAARRNFPGNGGAFDFFGCMRKFALLSLCGLIIIFIDVLWAEVRRSVFSKYGGITK